MSNLKDYKEIEELKPMGEYPMYWQYLTGHVNELINTLELYEKVRFNTATPEETLKWMKVFCIDNCNIKALNESEINNGYISYAKYVDEELKKCNGLIIMEIESSRTALEDLKNSRDRVNKTLEKNHN
jgi:hypothetical protein